MAVTGETDLRVDFVTAAGVRAGCRRPSPLLPAARASENLSASVQEMFGQWSLAHGVIPEVPFAGPEVGLG